MITENDDWRARNRNNEDSQNEEGQNRRPYQNYNRGSYGNQGGGYNRPSSGGYNNDRPRGYDQQRGGGYDRPRSNYQSRGGYDNNYNDRREDNYGSRPQRPYDSSALSGETGGLKKRRPRVGESSSGRPDNNRGGGGYNPRGGGYDQRGGGYDQRGGGYDQRGGGYDQRGGYNNDRRSGGYDPRGGQQRSSGGYGNDRRSSGGYNNPRGGGYNPRGGSSQNRQRTGDYNPHAKYSIRKQLKYREENFDPNEPLRLNKYLANAGICSRREADEFIKAGVVKVNGEVITELGTKVKRADTVTFHDNPVKLEHKVYVLLNKPKNCVTTADDPQERLTVMDLVKDACQERIFPVGRLDRNTTGVLLLTNDGDLASKLTHPKYLKKKIYHIWLDKEASVEDLQKLADGIELEDGEIHADAISYVDESDKSQIGIEIHSGRNRIVRRMFESVGYHVIRLDRVYFAGLTKKNLKRGTWRYLSEKEVSMLRMGAFE